VDTVLGPLVESGSFVRALMYWAEWKQLVPEGQDRDFAACVKEHGMRYEGKPLFEGMGRSAIVVFSAFFVGPRFAAFFAVKRVYAFPWSSPV